MLQKLILCLMIFLNSLLYGQYKVTKVNFSKEYDLTFNASGPILTEVDSLRNRIAVLHANSSMISIINGRKNTVTNIPITSRGIQHLKDESFLIDEKSGSVYAIGENNVHIVFPVQKTSKTFATKKQYEMVAVDESNGNAFLVGRESKELAFVDLKNEKVNYIPWAAREEALVNLNQTPPPPIRKVVCDSDLGKVFAIDGYTSNLTIFETSTGKIIDKRQLQLKNGARWHYAGYNKNTHHMYVVVENDKRQVLQAGKIDVQTGNDVIIDLPELTEGVGIKYNPKLDEIYIPYDNHPLVHVVDFKKKGEVTEIKLPLYGNDASAIDIVNNILYIASWAYGEIEVVNLITRKFIRRIPDLGIIPHTFNMSYNPRSKKLYLPIGGTAVNGVFGSAITSIDPNSAEVEKIYTGWSPTEMIQLPNKDEFLVFNAEDHFAHVRGDGTYLTYPLPFDYPHQAVYTKNGNIYLSYGPHQSYWPTVYIWGAKNGILHINRETFNIMDRRIPRLAHEITVDRNGILYALQNSWGKEKQFLTVLEDEIREFEVRKRIVLDNEINRETIQRILRYDSDTNQLYLVKIGETDLDNGLLQIIDVNTKSLVKNIEVGVNPTDLIFDKTFIYVANFDANTLTRINKNNFQTKEIKTGKQPLKFAELSGQIFVINHVDNTLQNVSKNKKYKIPARGKPDNLKLLADKLIITSHSTKYLEILSFNPKSEKFTPLHNESYPYGETGFDTNNSSFYMSGQFGDVLYDITKIRTDNSGRIWISDFLSGKLFIIDQNEK